MYESKFKSFNQHRYFFAALRSGDIRVPYKRKHSAGIGGSISGRVWREDTEVWGAVGVNQNYAPYAPLVIGNDEQQAEHHKGHWWQFEPTVKETAPKLAGPAVEKTVGEIVQGVLGS